MKRTDIKPLVTVAVPFQVTGWVQIRVVAEASVDVFVVDPDGRSEYERGDTFKSLVGSTNLPEHTLTACLPLGTWYLLIANRASDRVLMVDYELRPIYMGGPSIQL